MEAVADSRLLHGGAWTAELAHGKAWRLCYDSVGDKRGAEDRYLWDGLRRAQGNGAGTDFSGGGTLRSCKGESGVMMR